MTARDNGEVRAGRLSDGSDLEIFTANLAEGCMFAIRGAGVTPLVAKLLFDVMVAGQWVIVGANDENVVIAPHPDCVKTAPVDLGEVVVVSSAEDLAVLLSRGFDAWKEYRTRVFGR